MMDKIENFLVEIFYSEDVYSTVLHFTILVLFFVILGLIGTGIIMFIAKYPYVVVTALLGLVAYSFYRVWKRSNE